MRCSKFHPSVYGAGGAANEKKRYSKITRKRSLKEENRIKIAPEMKIIQLRSK